jgi:hypothetical protein
LRVVATFAFRDPQSVALDVTVMVAMDGMLD